MASTNVELPFSAMSEYIVSNHNTDYARNADSSSINRPYDFTHRQLRSRHIQLIGIGGTIGTALYVQIGHGLLNGGPASLFMAFTIWYVFRRVLTLGKVDASVVKFVEHECWSEEQFLNFIMSSSIKSISIVGSLSYAIT
jgi:amino acid permease